MRLGGGEQIKAKGGWQSVKRDEQSGSVRWTGIAGQALLPGETPMCTLSSGQYLLNGHFCERWRERSEAFQAVLATRYICSCIWGIVPH